MASLLNRVQRCRGSQNCDQIFIAQRDQTIKIAPLRCLIGRTQQLRLYLGCHSRPAKRFPPGVNGPRKTFKHAPHAAGPAGEGEGHQASHHHPTRRQTVFYGVLYGLRAGNAFDETMNRLAKEGELKSVGEVTRHLALKLDRTYSELAKMGHRRFDRAGRGSVAAKDFDKRNEMGGLNGCMIKKRSGRRISD